MRMIFPDLCFFNIICFFPLDSGVCWYKMMEDLTVESFDRWIEDLRRPSIVWVDNIDEYVQRREDYNVTALGIVREKAFNGVSVLL